MFQEEMDERDKEEELSCWLAASQMTGPPLGIRKTVQLYDRFGCLRYLWRASRDELREIANDILDREATQIFLDKKRQLDREKLLRTLKEQDIQAYYLYDPHFPALLREIHNPPFVLFMKGRLTPEDLRFNVGLVGTRRPTSYGQRLAKEMGKGLAESGATVISGMAVGIDSLAHWGAIEGGGKTVAVLGSGVDHCYPSSNRPLYTHLTEDPLGAVVSEFFPGTKPEPWRFPARNRIISGLSEAVAVIEAGETSGSLITAKLAFEQNREVFAVPGRIDSPASKGTNDLIARDIAHLLTDYKQIINSMNWAPLLTGREVPTMVQLYGREREIFEMISAEPVQFDFLCERSGMSAGELSATLTMLELAGVVMRLPGDWYERPKSTLEIR